MQSARPWVVALAVIAVCMSLGAACYESVVMAPNFAVNVPESLTHARGFLAQSHPGNFFRVLAPATQVLLLLSVILNWRARKARWWLVTALAFMVLTDVITYTFHYPRNDLMFVQPLENSTPEALEAAAREWGTGNYARIALIAGSAVYALRGLRACWGAAEKAAG